MDTRGETVGRFCAAMTDADAASIVHESVRVFGENVVMSSSFGIHSAVLLHLANSVFPGIPVIWIDTGYLPAETYRYVDTLVQRLNINLFPYQSAISPARMEAGMGRLWESDRPEDLDLYHAIRKVEPMKRALRDLNATAWIAGVRADQNSFRRSLGVAVEHWGVAKIHPLLGWSEGDVDRYLRKYDLPRHPLEAKGYRTVGDGHSSRPLRRDDRDSRATRFGGKRDECGLHVAAPTEAAAGVTFAFETVAVPPTGDPEQPLLAPEGVAHVLYY